MKGFGDVIAVILLITMGAISSFVWLLNQLFPSGSYNWEIIVAAVLGLALNGVYILFYKQKPAFRVCIGLFFIAWTVGLFLYAPLNRFFSVEYRDHGDAPQ